MKTIWKYEVPLSTGDFELQIPKGSMILGLRSQGLKLTLWALCDSEREKKPYKFRIGWTGQPFKYELEEILEFKGTEQVGPLVYHLFRVRNAGDVDIKKLKES